MAANGNLRREKVILEPAFRVLVRQGDTKVTRVVRLSKVDDLLELDTKTDLETNLWYPKSSDGSRMESQPYRIGHSVHDPSLEDLPASDLVPLMVFDQNDDQHMEAVAVCIEHVETGRLEALLIQERLDGAGVQKKPESRRVRELIGGA